jgi:hypothetical protein
MPLFNTNPRRSTSALAVFAAVFTCAVGWMAPARADRPADAPQIVNWDLEWSIDSHDAIEQLAKWDVVVLDIENEYYSRDHIEALKRLNPDIKVLAYMSPVDIVPNAASLDVGTAREYVGEALAVNPEWILHTSDGEEARFWEDFDMMNITDRSVNGSGETFNTFFSHFIRDAVVKDDIWDGIFFDNLWESISFVSEDIDLDNDGNAESVEDMDKAWRAGVKKMLKRTRRYAKNFRKGFIITGNGGAKYYEHLNGIGLEGYPDSVYDN